MTMWDRALVAGAVLMLLAACDNGPSAVATAPDAAAQRFAETGRDVAGPARERPDREGRAQAEVPQLDGRPIWSQTNDRSAEENARRAFERNGEAFGAETLDAFVKTAHAFVSDPPEGAETITRANGDVLIYDAKSNVFAVRTREGAPRTLFKPDDGAAYWAEQKSRETRRAAARDRRSDEG